MEYRVTYSSKLLGWVAYLGKWSMLDVYVLMAVSRFAKAFLISDCARTSRSTCRVCSSQLAQQLPAKVARAADQAASKPGRCPAAHRQVMVAMRMDPLQLCRDESAGPPNPTVVGVEDMVSVQQLCLSLPFAAFPQR